MDTKSFVKEQIDEGKALLEAMTQHDFPWVKAFWHFGDDRSRLIISSAVVDRFGTLASYGKLRKIYEKLGPQNLSLMSITLLGKRDDEVEALHGIGSYDYTSVVTRKRA